MSRRKKILFASIFALLLAAIAVLLLTGNEPAPPGSTPDEPFDDVTEKCRELDFNADKVIAFVSGLPHEEYAGSLRGPLGTLWSGAGNQLDRAHLLMEMLLRCKAEARLAEYDGVCAQKRSAMDWISVGPGAKSGEPRRFFEQIPVELKHRLAITVRTWIKDGESKDTKVLLSTADLAGARVTLSYQPGLAVLQVGRQSWSHPIPAAALRQEIVFEHSLPDGSLTRVRRELWTSELKGEYPNVFDARNRYAIRVMTGFLPPGVRTRERELNKTAPELDRFNDAAALSFLEASDADARRLARSLGVRAYFTSPRIVIAATEFDGRDRVATIDLRKNDLYVDAPDDRRISFNLLRSFHDQALEAEALRRLTGQEAYSAIELLLSAGRGIPDTLSERRRILYDELGRFFRDARIGARLKVAPAGRSDALFVQFTKIDAGLLRAKLSDSIPADPYTMPRLSLRVDDLPLILNEVEAAFAVTGRLPMTYAIEVEFTDAPAGAAFVDARFFQFSADALEFEYQIKETTPDVLIETLDYFDEANKAFFGAPQAGKIRIHKEDAESGSVYTNWYEMPADQRAGRLFALFSRKMRRELIEQGRTQMRYRRRDGSLSDPIALFLCDKKPVRIPVNHRSVEFAALVVGGDFEKNNPTKKAQAEYPDRIMDGFYLGNKFVVLDDETLPLVVGGAYQPDLSGIQIQTSVNGRVIEAGTGRGVAGAEVQIAGTRSKGTAWGDGRLSLPLIDKAFAEFEIQASAPGYETYRAKVDLRKPGALPLSIEMQPRPDRRGFLWIDKASIAELAKASLSNRARLLIAEFLAENESSGVFVPRGDVFGHLGTVSAWLEVNTRTFEVYGRLEDGLYGSTIRPSGVIPPYWMPKAAVSYFSGRITAWWAWSTGAVSAVKLAMEDGSVDLIQMYKHACRVTDEIMQLYLGMTSGLGAAITGPFMVNAAFKKGLADGCAWAKKFYKEAWGP